ncbi:MAG: helix-turn-helix domain-containing protein [Phycisphaerales bacterium]
MTHPKNELRLYLDAWRLAGLGTAELAVMVRTWSHTDAEGATFVSTSTIAEALELSDRRVREVLAHADELGLLDAAPAGRRTLRRFRRPRIAEPHPPESPVDEQGPPPVDSRGLRNPGRHDCGTSPAAIAEPHPPHKYPGRTQEEASGAAPVDKTTAELVEDHLRRHLAHRADAIRNPVAYAQSQRDELAEAARAGQDLEDRWPTRTAGGEHAGRFLPGTGWIA